MGMEARPQLKHIHLNHRMCNEELGRSFFLSPGREPLNIAIFCVIPGGPLDTP